MNSNSFVSVEQLLSDILLYCSDTELRKGRNRGWYESQMQQALEELAFDTFFQIVTVDQTIPDNLPVRIPLDSGIFNVRELYLFNGEECDMESSARVHLKRHFNNKTATNGFYTANVKDGDADSDEFYSSSVVLPTGLYYGNVLNGILQLSPNAIAYDNVRIVANGMGCEIGDVPVVPRFFRQAVIDFVCMNFYKTRFADTHEKGDLVMMQQFEKQLYVGTGRPNNPGSWKQAERRIKSMDTWEKNEMSEYFRQMYF